jgi:hypothetical protein
MTQITRIPRDIEISYLPTGRQAQHDIHYFLVSPFEKRSL